MSPLFPTITADHWRAAIARARATPNRISLKIQQHLKTRPSR